MFTGILCFKPQKEKEDKRNPPYSKEKGAIHFNRMPENTVPSGKRAVLSPPVSRRQESPAAKPRAANSSQAGPQLSKRPRRETPEKTRRLPPQAPPPPKRGFFRKAKISTMVQFSAKPERSRRRKFLSCNKRLKSIFFRACTPNQTGRSGSGLKWRGMNALWRLEKAGASGIPLAPAWWGRVDSNHRSQ